jgi:hypothetical protein
MLQAAGSANTGRIDRPADERSRVALKAAWAAFDLAPNERTTKGRLAKLLWHYPGKLQPDRRAAYLKLITDREVDPYFISSAGWRLLLGSYRFAEDAADADFEALVTDLEHDELALTLLREAPSMFREGRTPFEPPAPLAVDVWAMAAPSRVRCRIENSNEP